MSGERVVRNTTTTTVALGGAIFGVILVALTVRYALVHSPGSSKTLENQWLLAAFLLAATAYLFMLSRTRVVVTAGVRIGGGPAGRTFVVKLRLCNGHSIRCTGIGRGRPHPRRAPRRFRGAPHAAGPLLTGGSCP